MNCPTGVKKLETKISGFDFISGGGLPMGRTTLFSGTAGSAKSVFGAQFLVEGIRHSQQPGVFVTFEESPENIRQNLKSFGWDILAWEAQGKWTFIDASPQPYEEVTVSGDFDLHGLLLRLRDAVQKTGAQRVCLDSIGSIFHEFLDPSAIRRELFGIASSLNQLGVTTILTSERIHEYGEIARFGVEEFVADNVVILRNVLEEEKRRRTVEILKFRGTNHLKGEFPFAILPGEGIVVHPLCSSLELGKKSSFTRISSGIPDLDVMCGGGFFRDSIILVSGATGTGRTLTAIQFLAGGFKNGERTLLFSFEESREQLFRNARGWGIDFKTMEEEGKLLVICEYPEVMGLEDHLVSMKKAIECFKPDRVAVDNFSALERISTIKLFREFVIGLTSRLTHQEIAGLFTTTTPSLMGGTSVTESHISTIADSIILLRYVEIFGEMRRGLTVLKMRGSTHEKDIREFHIDSTGMHIGRPFRGVSGILSGTPQHRNLEEIDHVRGLFRETNS